MYLEIFHEIFRNISENLLIYFKKFPVKFRIISRNTSKKFGKFLKYSDILPKFLRIISENFEKPFKKFQLKSWKISRNISDNFEMYFRKFPNFSRNILEILGKYF